MSMFHVARVFLILIAGLQGSAPAITAPIPGQTLQGQVAVTGTIDPANFSSAELAFAYSSDPTDTWFLIQFLSQPVQDSTLATWDTTTVTDGEYRLRLRVHFADGSYQDVMVENLHVENSATATPTAAATATPLSNQAPASLYTEEALPTEAPAVPADATPVIAPAPPTPQPLPTNPAAISTSSVFSYLGRGALLALILFIVLGLFLRLRRS